MLLTGFVPTEVIAAGVSSTLDLDPAEGGVGVSSSSLLTMNVTEALGLLSTAAIRESR